MNSTSFAQEARELGVIPEVSVGKELFDRFHEECPGLALMRLVIYSDNMEKIVGAPGYGIVAPDLQDGYVHFAEACWAAGLLLDAWNWRPQVLTPNGGWATCEQSVLADAHPL